jgi:hypothetical protein
MRPGIFVVDSVRTSLGDEPLYGVIGQWTTVAGLINQRLDLCKLGDHQIVAFADYPQRERPAFNTPPCPIRRQFRVFGEPPAQSIEQHRSWFAAQSAVLQCPADTLVGRRGKAGDLVLEFSSAGLRQYPLASARLRDDRRPVAVHEFRQFCAR